MPCFMRTFCRRNRKPWRLSAYEHLGQSFFAGGSPLTRQAFYFCGVDSHEEVDPLCFYHAAEYGQAYLEGTTSYLQGRDRRTFLSSGSRQSLNLPTDYFAEGQLGEGGVVKRVRARVWSSHDGCARPRIHIALPRTVGPAFETGPALLVQYNSPIFRAGPVSGMYRFQGRKQALVLQITAMKTLAGSVELSPIFAASHRCIPAPWSNLGGSQPAQAQKKPLRGARKLRMTSSTPTDNTR